MQRGNHAVSAFARTVKNFGERYRRLRSDQQSLMRATHQQADFKAHSDHPRRPASLYRYWVNGNGERQEQAVGRFTPFGHPRWDGNGNRISARQTR
jgi:hypothetical protein